MRGHAAVRLQTIAVSALLLAITSGLAVVGWVVRELNNSFNDEYIPAWQHPFAYGSSWAASQLALASVVLLLMLPSAMWHERLGHWARRMLAAAVAANSILGIGHVAWLYTADPPPGVSFGSDMGPHWLILVEELPNWGLASVVLVLYVNSTGWFARRAAYRDKQPDAPVAEMGEGPYLRD